jgi:hypothetical protein
MIKNDAIIGVRPSCDGELTKSISLFQRKLPEGVVNSFVSFKELHSMIYFITYVNISGRSSSLTISVPRKTFQNFVTESDA